MLVPIMRSKRLYQIDKSIGISRYKVNDPIVFSESKIYGDVLYNNLKGHITDINEFEDRVYFEIELETIVDSTVKVIEGGNHCQFGSYSFQKGDGTASISTQQQWLQATQFIADQFGNDKITGNYYVNNRE